MKQPLDTWRESHKLINWDDCKVTLRGSKKDEGLPHFKWMKLNKLQNNTLRNAGNVQNALFERISELKYCKIELVKKKNVHTSQRE